MKPSHGALGHAARLGSSIGRPIVASPGLWLRHASTTTSRRQPRPRHTAKVAACAAVLAVAAASAYYYSHLFKEQSSEPQAAAKAELEFEKPRKLPLSKEENRELISSQHLQVKNSWEHPGVYLWGSNVGKVVDPGSDDKVVKLPRRLVYLDGQLLRDIKLKQNFGAAITENGDLIQWGVAFSKADARPDKTLTGKDLVKLSVSADRIIALSRAGAVYSVPASRSDLLEGAKLDRKSSWSLWSSGGKETLSFRELTPAKLSRGEKIVQVSSGLEHCLMLTNKGRVFSAASSTLSFPSRGQMGIPGLEWETRPAGAYDQAHEMQTLSGIKVEQIATGDYHSVVLDKLGRVFSFGDNTYGQLGLETDGAMVSVSAPTMVNVNKLYAKSGLVPKVSMIEAGGSNTFFAVDVEMPLGHGTSQAVAPARRMPQGVSDVWACGHGVTGALGTGKWTHVSVAPTKIKALSSLMEFNEASNKMVPIRLKALSVGSTHCSAVMDNVTETSISQRSSKPETNWGADVVFWGGNEYFQLGTGKRSNMNTPGYIGPLDGGEGDEEKGRKGEVHRLCLTPRQTARLGPGAQGRKATLEQKVECGQFVTGVYSAV
ncbi:hypothetical protein CDD81_4527 [Ophiocordyceps australis]|uniref:Uncharacterized protein n=1 Tax=Ophiocordyceps australis TaxID=1399860 RepID=A0A2C5YB14_9HYPO|nr:hypothetical protein CDD81_4527 [Ophiocordyceps australis]